MDPTSDHPGATRRRGAALEATILEAAWAELAETGYAHLTMEGVATRAHTGKQVLYRRWPNRARLVMAAIIHNLGSIVDTVPDTGALRTDVLTILRSMIGRRRHLSLDVILGLMAEAPDLDPWPSTKTQDAMTVILHNAVDRGELPHADVSQHITTLPFVLLRYEVLWHTSQLKNATDEEIEQFLMEIVDDVFLPLIRTVTNTPPP